jgi:rRNA maturation protein Nop10
MKERNFTDVVTGDNSTLPWSSVDALANGYTRWMDRDGCDRCKAEGRGDGKKARYLKDNSCSFCLSTDAHMLWSTWIQGDPGRPEIWSTDPQTSIALGLDWYYGSPSHPIMCPHGPHLRKTSITTGRCVECEKDAAYFRALNKGPRAIARAAGERYYTPVEACPACGKVATRDVMSNACAGCSRNKGPRAIARAAGERYYTPVEACPACGKVAQRHVVTNGCTGCLKGVDARRSPSQTFAKENPDFILSRESAVDLGFTLFRTGESCRRGHAGWRYVSTGNCLECLRG